MTQFRLRITLALLTLLARLPLGTLHVLSDMAAFVLGRVAGYRRRVVTTNIRNSFPEMTSREVGHTARLFYRHLCDIVVETVKLLHISDEEMRRRVRVEGTDRMEAAAADGKPVILMLGHYGNWEWVQEIMKRYSRPALSAEIYRPAKSKLFNAIMTRIRSRFPTELISQKTAVRTLMRHYARGEQFIVGFISDQRPNSKNLYNWTTFLHQDTPYAVGGEEIGRHIGAHFFYLDIEQTRRSHYTMTFKPIVPADDENEHPYTIAFMRMMEQTIRRNPPLWLWSHNRWKYKRQKETTT